ncbi:MAG: hypothetical protein ACQEVA_23510 [Myxococcota bacterium]
MWTASKIARIIGLGATFAAVLLVLSTGPASAQARSMATETDYSPKRDAFSLLLRTGAGSLYGPGFQTGQLSYAREGMVDSENRKPFSSLRQAGMTYGVSATGEIATHDLWAFGVTGLVGFNATSARRGGIANDLETREKLQGVSYGGGLRASYGTDDHRATVDVVYTRSHLEGSVDWTVDDIFSEAYGSTARYEYDLERFAALVGYEFTMGGPFFGFLQGGAQFLPRQKTRREQRGTVPWAPPGDSFSNDIESRDLDTRSGEVTFSPELQYALGAGIGVRF